MLLSRLATSMHQRPRLCATSARHLCAALRGVPPPSALAAAAESKAAERRPTILTVPLYSPAAFEVRSLLDALRLCSRALWLSVNLLPPVLLLLPALLLPERMGLWERMEAAVLRALERGGPCLVKLGQWASTRPDVLPLSTCRTLAALHDSVPAHTLEQTHAAIEEAFGARVDVLFSRISASPVGSGCIAQVHEGETRAGERVAIKVLHPYVEELVSMDLLLLRLAAQAVEALVPLRGLRWLALVESVECFSHFMASQLDLRTEAHNLERFRANFAAAGGGDVRFARPLREEGLVSRTVLVSPAPGPPIPSPTDELDTARCIALPQPARGRRPSARLELTCKPRARLAPSLSQTPTALCPSSLTQVESFVEGEVLSQMLKATRRRRERPHSGKSGAELEVEHGQLGLGHERDVELARRGLQAFFTMVCSIGQWNSASASHPQLPQAEVLQAQPGAICA